MSKFVKLTLAQTNQEILVNLDNVVLFENGNYNGVLHRHIVTTSNDEEFKRILVKEKSTTFTKFL